MLEKDSLKSEGVDGLLVRSLKFGIDEHDQDRSQLQFTNYGLKR